MRRLSGATTRGARLPSAAYCEASSGLAYRTLRSSAKRRPSDAPRYRPAMAARAEVTSPSISSAVPRASMPRNGRTASKTRRAHRGSRLRWRSFTSPSAITTSKAASAKRNQTGVTSALPSVLYVVSVAGAGASSSERTGSNQPSAPAAGSRSPISRDRSREPRGANRAGDAAMVRSRHEIVPLSCGPGGRRPARPSGPSLSFPKVKKRLDVLLVERGLAASRSQAQALVLAGRVRGHAKAGSLLDEDGAARGHAAAPLRLARRREARPRARHALGRRRGRGLPRSRRVDRRVHGLPPPGRRRPGLRARRRPRPAPRAPR